MEYSVATLFYIKRDKPCFKKIIKSLSSKSQPSEVTLAKNISSVITHILIEMEGSETKEEFKSKAEGYKIYDWLELQTALLNGSYSVPETLEEIQSMLEGF